MSRYRIGIHSHCHCHLSHVTVTVAFMMTYLSLSFVGWLVSFCDGRTDVWRETSVEPPRRSDEGHEEFVRSFLRSSLLQMYRSNWSLCGDGSATIA